MRSVVQAPVSVLDMLRAATEPVKRLVALKLIKAGMDDNRRVRLRLSVITLPIGPLSNEKNSCQT
jgi:hypothetical protein